MFMEELLYVQIKKTFFYDLYSLKQNEPIIDACDIQISYF